MNGTINLKLTLTPAEVKAVARVLNADATGYGYLADDGDLRDNLLKKIVWLATMEHRPMIMTPEIAAVTHRDFIDHQRAAGLRRLPKSKRITTRQLR